MFKSILDTSLEEFVRLFRVLITLSSLATVLPTSPLAQTIALRDFTRVDVTDLPEGGDFRRIPCAVLPKTFVNVDKTRFRIPVQARPGFYCFAASNDDDRKINLEDVNQAELLSHEPIALKGTLAGMPNPRAAVLLLMDNPRVQALIVATGAYLGSLGARYATTAKVTFPDLTHFFAAKKGEETVGGGSEADNGALDQTVRLGPLKELPKTDQKASPIRRPRTKGEALGQGVVRQLQKGLTALENERKRRRSSEQEEPPSKEEP